MIRNILQRIKESKGGFTLVELMVTMVLVGILLGASAAGIFYYQKWSVWQRQEHYARTLFLAAQSGMTQYSTDKHLEEFDKEAQTSAQAIVKQNQLLIPVTDENGQVVNVSAIWKNDDGQTASNLYYVTGTPADYKAYKNGSADASHTLLYDIFDAYLYDKTLLANGCVSVEFDARDGLVYSVLYSDRAEALSYTGCTSTMANIVNRSKENRKGSGSDNSTGLCFGYYGADSLSKAADTATKVKVLNASLHNEETLNLTWKLSEGETAVSLMNYQVMICDAKTNEELLEISFNNASLSGQKTEEGYYYSIPSESAEDELKVVAAEVTSFADKKEEKLGTYPFLAYIDEELNVTLVLDAVDLSATQAAYETYRRTDEPGELMNTLSLHRFGLERYGVDEISCIVQGGGSGYQITGRRQSNSELMYFAREDGEDTDEEDGTSYEIQNARHLYNIRFAEMITDASVYAAKEDEKNENTYIVSRDFAWGYEKEEDDEIDETLQESDSILAKGMVYQNGLPVKEADTAFPMITQLREGSSLGSKDGDEVYTIDYLTLSDTANAGTGSSNRWYPQGAGTAFVLENLGTIHDLFLDHVSVTGDQNTAAVCAYNGGTLENLTVAGSIEAKDFAAGIFAASLPMKEEDETLSKLVNHAKVTADGTAAGIVAQTKEKVLLEDCVNTGVIEAAVAAGITTAECENLVLMRCQNYAPIISSDNESYGITSNLTANLTDCVGVSENVYPIAADANESENCLYFISGGEKLEDALLADICDISLTIGETDATGSYREYPFVEASEKQLQNLIKHQSEDVPVFSSSSFDIKEQRCPIYTAFLNGTCKLSDVTLTWLKEGTYKFDVLYADAEDGVWKELAAGLQAEGKDVYDGGTVSVKAPDGIEATALKIIVTDATDGCDVALGSIEAAGSWSTEGVKVACESDDSNNNEDQKENQKNEDGDEPENEQKTPGIGTALYVYKEGELTEEDQAEIYTKWTAFAGSLSVSPLLLNTEEAKTDEDSENIRIRVWEKLSSELTDLTVFDKTQPEPGIPGGITFTKENGSWMIRFWPGLFAKYYEYEAEYETYERDSNNQPVLENGLLKKTKIGSKNGEITDNFLELPDELEGQKIDAVVFHVRSVNEEGTSEWSTAQAADERIQLPALSYHLRLCSENTGVSDDEDKTALYEIVIDNKDDFTSIAAGDRELTVTATYSSADSDEEKRQSSSVKFGWEETGHIAVTSEEAININCRVSCPGYKSSTYSEKTFDVLSANTVCENESVFDASLKPDKMYSGFKNEDASLYQILAGHAQKKEMEIQTALEAVDEELQVPVQYQAAIKKCSTDKMEQVHFDTADCTEMTVVAYPVTLMSGQVELGHIVCQANGSESWSASELLVARVTNDGVLAAPEDSAFSSCDSLIQSGKVMDGYAILAEEDGYRLYYSPLLKNSALMQHSSSNQSLYGVWRYELTQEESEITLPVLISVNKKTTDDDEIDASNGALVMWDAENDKPKYEGTSYEVNVTALLKTNEEMLLLSKEEIASDEETSYSCNVSVPEDCVSLTVQVKREGITDKNGFTISKPSTSTLSVRIKEYESEPETETESESEDPSESESESESENESESETPPEPEPLAAPELFVSDKKQEFLYPIFDLDENENWKDSGRKASAWQGSIYFDVDANEEGCAGYKINVLSLLKSRQMTRDTLFYRDAFSFEIVKDDSQAGFYVRSMLSTKSGGYTMEQNDTQGGLIGVYEMYTDRSNGIYTYLIPYYVSCESKQEKVLVYAWLKQTNTTDENGDIISARFEVFVTDGAAPLGEAYITDSDCAVISVQALAETTTAEGEQKQWLDSDVTSLYRDKGTDEFKKTQKEKEKMEDTFSDANVEQCDNTGFAYCFAQGTGTSEYLVQTMQQRVTREGKQTCTYRLLPVYWKYDTDGVQKKYSVYLPEDGYAVPYAEQVNGNEPYLLYDLSICFASMDEIGLSDWSKVSANAHDGDNKTFVLSKNTSLGHLTAPKFTGLAGEKEKAYPLLDQSNQPVSEILAKTNEISWSLNSDWEKAAGFDATLFFNRQDGQTTALTFYWRAEDWIKDPAAWEASYGSSLLEKLTVCEAEEEETTEEESTEEKSTEESSVEVSSIEETSSEKETTESASSEPSTTIEATSKESISSEETTQTQEQESTTSLQTPEATTLLPSSETSLPEIQQTMEEASPAPVQEAKIERKNVILRAAAPSIKSFLFEVKAVLTITSTVLTDGSTQYQFTLTVPKELPDNYTDEEQNKLKLMQLDHIKTIVVLQDEDSPYYGQIDVEMTSE